MYRGRLYRVGALPGTGRGARASRPASRAGPDSDCRRVPERGRARGVIGRNGLGTFARSRRSTHRPQSDRRELPGCLYSPGTGSLVSPGQPLGVEAAGVVLDVGPEVAGFKPGDHVAYAMLPPGSYATHRNVPASQLVRIPAHVDDETAAAVLLKGLTAEYLLNRLHPLRPRDRTGARGRRRTGRHRGAMGAGARRRRHRYRLLGRQSPGGAPAWLPGSGGDLRLQFSSAVLSATGGRGVDLIVDGLGDRESGATLHRSPYLATGSASASKRAVVSDLTGCADREERDILPAGALSLHRGLQRLAEMAGRLSSAVPEKCVRQSVPAIGWLLPPMRTGHSIARHTRFADPIP